VLFGGAKGAAGVFSISKGSVTQQLQIATDGTVTAAKWARGRAVLATSTGNVQVFEEGSATTERADHTDRVNALAVHPSKAVVASVGQDGKAIFYDLTTGSEPMQIQTHSSLSSASFHPKGILFAAGGDYATGLKAAAAAGEIGQIKIFDARKGMCLFSFVCSGSVQALSFSENGMWLASASKGSNVQIWSLENNSRVHTIASFNVDDLLWDATGQYLLMGGAGGVSVEHYDKESEGWSKVLDAKEPASQAVEWGANAASILSLGTEGAVNQLS